jgi:tRNA threonylcarbamoyladenosine biosynthesis protein TsaB
VIVLGIDTSGYVNAVGIVDGKKVLADACFTARTDSLEQIVANIDDVLKGAGLTPEKVAGIGVGLGPGSWTGIRVGVTVGKMLAFGLDKPVAGISTLEVLAFSAGETPRLVCPVISVGAGNAVYAGRYRWNNSEIVRQGEYYVGDIEGLGALIDEPGVIVGTGVSVSAEIIARVAGQDVIAIEKQPSGAAVAGLAEKRLISGKPDDTLALTPLYLKESTARVFVNKYQGK